MDAKIWPIVREWLADLTDVRALERDDYLARHCPDPALRQEVVAMLEDPVSISRIVRGAAFKPGARIGPYEIIEAIASGGMSEIYRARDPKLGRDVAIKVLPVLFAEDRGRRGRFEREARVLASLNHPNIVTIFSLEEADGLFSLAMEYVKGTTLRDLIGKRGLPVTEIFNVAIPLSDAISTAHQKGITHRDLKPANVMVTENGRVKVLDFGLAKLIEVTPVEGGGAECSIHALTDEGRIVGTVAYMSPEQAEGKSIDHRSDIFSLGTIMYEMATGVRPFTGETNLSILSAIVKDTPRSVTDVNPAIPREFARVIMRCLAKEVGRRYQTAVDLRNELEELRTELEFDHVTPPRQSRSRRPPMKSFPTPEQGPGHLAGSHRTRRSDGRNWSSQPLLARAYVAAVIALGAGSVVLLIPRAVPRPALFAFTLLAACLTSAWKVALPIPGGVTLSVSYAAGMMALLLLGPELAIVIAAVGAWVQCTVNLKTGRQPLHRTLFSMAVGAVTIALTGIVYRVLGGTVVSSAFVPIATLVKPVAGAIATQFCINSGLMAGAIALATRQRASRVWREDFLWSAASFMVSGAAGVAAAIVIAAGKHWTAVLLLAPVYLIYRTYGVFAGRGRTRRLNPVRRSSDRPPSP